MRKTLRALVLVSLLVSICRQAEANLVFPAIAHQFMVSAVVPGYYSVVLAILIVFAEAFFIKRFFQRGWVYGLILSFLINLFSSIAGVFIVTSLEGMTRNISMGIFGYADMRLGTYLGMIPGYLITVVLEGFCLLGWTILVRRELLATRRLVNLPFLMNLVSYLILSLGILAADIATNGQNFKTF